MTDSVSPINSTGSLIRGAFPRPAGMGWPLTGWSCHQTAVRTKGTLFRPSRRKGWPTPNKGFRKDDWKEADGNKDEARMLSESNKDDQERGSTGRRTTVGPLPPVQRKRPPVCSQAV